MSYDINLKCPVTGETLEVSSPHFMAGGTCALGGTKLLWLNITYNYAPWYRKKGVFPDNGEGRNGIRGLYGLSGVESIPVLENAISKLKKSRSPFTKAKLEEYDNDYWRPTRANAIKPLYQLLAFAKMRPDGVWDGD